MNSDRINLTDVVAEARAFSMSLPKKKPHRMALMRKIARTLQDRQGNFFFSQIHYVLELAYEDNFNELEDQIIQEIDEWVENDKNVEFLGKEGMFYVYRLN